MPRRFIELCMISILCRNLDDFSFLSCIFNNNNVIYFVCVEIAVKLNRKS